MKLCSSLKYWIPIFTCYVQLRYLMPISFTIVSLVQSCKLYNKKYMIASTKITNTEIFTLIAVLVFEPSSFANKQKRQQKLLKSRLLFKISRVNYSKKYKQLKCQIFWIFLKHVSDYLSVLFQSAWLYLLLAVVLITLKTNQAKLNKPANDKQGPYNLTIHLDIISLFCSEIVHSYRSMLCKIFHKYCSGVYILFLSYNIQIKYLPR